MSRRKAGLLLGVALLLTMVVGVVLGATGAGPAVTLLALVAVVVAITVPAMLFMRHRRQEPPGTPKYPLAPWHRRVSTFGVVFFALLAMVWVWLLVTGISAGDSTGRLAWNAAQLALALGLLATNQVMLRRDARARRAAEEGDDGAGGAPGALDTRGTRPQQTP
ncbi:hypothetical protein [Streptomyces bohaiensis]|uniref:hypothetical protein n=1 Tax=Streptomyces bohaiensis TaxID=1431344 RepID=UPI003B75FD55